jgi:hypothetical protein
MRGSFEKVEDDGTLTESVAVVPRKVGFSAYFLLISSEVRRISDGEPRIV